MYSVLKFIENIIKYFHIKIKVFYWKLKYGNRLKIGKKFRFRKGLIINISKNGYLEIGNNCSFNNYCSINCHQHIVIGNNNMFGENVKLYDHNHVFNDKSVDMQTTFKDGEIIIGNDNWIGSNSVFLKDATLKNNNVVGSGVILKDKIESELILKNGNPIIKEKINYIISIGEDNE